MFQRIAATRAARGAAFLDRIHSGWFKKVRPNILDIGSATNCVLGQLYGDFSRGCCRVRIYPLPFFGRAVGYGFIRYGFIGSHRHLTRAWRREIARRHAEAAVHTEKWVLVEA